MLVLEHTPAKLGNQAIRPDIATCANLYQDGSRQRIALTEVEVSM